jgi:hypothetical protein
MKKLLFLMIAVSLTASNPATGQSLLKRVTKSVSDELLGKPAEGSNKFANQPEPASACEGAELIIDLGGTLKLDYTEISIKTGDDGSILLKDRITSKYYIVKDGKTQGPVPEGDPRLAGFENMGEASTSKEAILLMYKEYITKTGDKYQITFGGKTYGPYAQVNSFTVTRSKDKFAAMVTENIVVTDEQGKKMDEAIKNAKTDQEKMELAMKYSQEMQQKMMQGGGPSSITPKLVTNIPNATFDPMKSGGGTLNGQIKFDDILVVAYDRIIDLQGKTVLTLSQEAIGTEQMYVNTSNTKYAVYNYGTLSFSDKTSIPELFNPHLVRVDGKVYLAYMYYSPKNNSVMQCKILF